MCSGLNYPVMQVIGWVRLNLPHAFSEAVYYVNGIKGRYYLSCIGMIHPSFTQWGCPNFGTLVLPKSLFSLELFSFENKKKAVITSEIGGLGIQEVFYILTTYYIHFLFLGKVQEKKFALFFSVKFSVERQPQGTFLGGLI